VREGGHSPDGVDARRGSGLGDGINHTVSGALVALDVQKALADGISRARSAAAARVRDLHAIHGAG